MKRLFTIFVIVAALAMPAAASDFDLSSLLGGNKKGNSGNNQSSQGTEQQSTGSQQQSNPLGGLGSLLGGGNSSSEDNPLGGLGDILGGVVTAITGSNTLTPADLVGTWKYSGPAVTFDSDNALQKIGGAAATSVVEKKLEPYYKKAGVTNLVLTVEADSSFTMTMKMATVKGTLATGQNGKMIFNFQAFQKINLGKMEAMVSKAGNTLKLTFDVSKIKDIVDKVAAVSNNSTFQSVSGILSSYDGIYAGFTLKKK